MGDCNIDLLKDDSDRPTHNYLGLIYSYSMIPSILKPTRITETSATIIDNILTNCDNEITTAILVTDITDHFPTILINKTTNVNDAKNKSDSEKNKLPYTKESTQTIIFLISNKSFPNLIRMMHHMVLMQIVIITILLTNSRNFMTNVFH